MNKGVDKNEKIESMENVYQKLLEQGFYATIDDNNSFISVKTSNYTVCGDDDLITLKRNNSLVETSTHVLCSNEDELYNKIYEIFISYLKQPERFISQKKSYIFKIIFIIVLIIGVYLMVTYFTGK